MRDNVESMVASHGGDRATETSPGHRAKTLDDVTEEMLSNRKFSILQHEIHLMDKKRERKSSPGGKRGMKGKGEATSSKRFSSSSNGGHQPLTFLDELDSRIAHLRLSPRSRHSKDKEVVDRVLREMMLKLNDVKINNIRAEMEKGGKVGIDQFMSILYRHLQEFIHDDSSSSKERLPLDHHTPSQVGGVGLNQRTIPQSYFMKSALEIFNEIDLHGYSYINWGGFAAYLLGKPYESDAHRRKPSQANMSPYFIDINVPHSRKHSNPIDKIYTISPLNQVVVLEHRNSDIAIYNKHTLEQCAVLKDFDGYPVACEYIPHAQQLVTSCFNQKLCVWQLGQGQNQYRIAIADDKIQKNIFPTPHVQTALKWSVRHHRLYSGGYTGFIHIWNHFKREEVSCIPAHTAMINDMCRLDNVDCLVSASSDGLIHLWDEATFGKRQSFAAHTRGVLGLAYSENLKLLVSAGYDHEAMVWNPYVPNLLYKLKGHRAPLAGVKLVTDSPTTMATADVDGVFKIWDLRTYRCLQTLSREEDKGISSFDVLPNSQKIVSGTKYLHFFAQRKDRQLMWTADTRPADCLLYNSASQQFVTCHERDVKIWSAFTGSLVKTYTNLTERDISCIGLDNTERKLIVADDEGKISMFNYSNGTLIRQSRVHEGEILSMTYVGKDNHLISVGKDRYITVEDIAEEDPTPSRLMDTDGCHRHDITCIAYSDVQAIIATGSTDCMVKIWDYDTGRILANYSHTHPITALVFIEKINCLLASDSSGLVKLWATRYSSVSPDSCILTVSFLDIFSSRNLNFSHSSEERVEERPQGSRRTGLQDIQTNFEKKILIDTAVVSMVWVAETNTLIIATELGYIRAWSFKKIITTLADLQGKGSSIALPPVDKSMIRLLWSIKGHDEDIICMKYIPKPESIVSSSCDRTVKIWSMSGVVLGTLVQGTRTDVWNFPVNVSEIEAQQGTAIDHTASALKSTIGDPPLEVSNPTNARSALPDINVCWMVESPHMIVNMEEFKAAAMQQAKLKQKPKVNLKPLRPVQKARTMADLVEKSASRILARQSKSANSSPSHAGDNRRRGSGGQEGGRKRSASPIRT